MEKNHKTLCSELESFSFTKELSIEQVEINRFLVSKDSSLSPFLSSESRYHYLWSLDLSNQRLSSLPPLTELPALGFLNLANNSLTFHAIQDALRPIHPLLHLILVGNQLIQSMLPESRKFLIYILPNVWCLDYLYVSDKQGQLAMDYFEMEEGRHSDLFLYHFLPFHPAFVPTRVLQKRDAVFMDGWPTWPQFLFKHLPSSIASPPIGSQLWHLGILAMDLQAEIHSHESTMDQSCKQWIFEFIDQEISCLHFLLLTLLLVDPRFPTNLAHTCISDLYCQITPPVPFLSLPQFFSLSKQCLMKLITILLALLEIELEKMQFIDTFFIQSLHRHVRYLIGHQHNVTPFLPSKRITLELLLLCTSVRDPLIFIEFYPDLMRIFDSQQANSNLKSSILQVHSGRKDEHMEEVKIYVIELKYEFCMDLENELKKLEEKRIKEMM